MRMLVLVCTILITSSAHGGGVQSVPLAECDFFTTMGILKFESIQRAGTIAERSLPLVESLQKIIAKSDNRRATLAENLSKEDSVDFARLTQQLQATQLASLIESHRERDLKVFEQMVRIADQEYRWRNVPQKGDADFLPYVFLLLARERLGDVEARGLNERQCSMSHALTQLALPAYEAINKTPNVKSVMDWANYLTQKYSDRPLDAQKMTLEDAARWQQVRQPVESLLRHRTYLMDIERLKIIFDGAELNAFTKTQDLTFAAGDIKKIGMTLDNMLQRKQVSEEMQKAIRIWFAINEQIPASYVDALAQIADGKARETAPPPKAKPKSKPKFKEAN